MKDPCLECLVRVTCWQECDDKRNFTTLLSTAIITEDKSELTKLIKNNFKHL